MQDETSPAPTLDPSAAAASPAVPANVEQNSAEQQANQQQANQNEQAKAEFTEFQKIDLRIAQIMEAVRVEKSAKLVKLQIDLGPDLGRRQIVAGVGKHYTPETLVGRKIVVVANLAPAKLMGETSNGMLLAATTAEGFLELISVGPETPIGAKVS